MKWKSKRSPRDRAVDSIEEMSWRICERARSSSVSSVHSATIPSPLGGDVSRQLVIEGVGRLT